MKKELALEKYSFEKIPCIVCDGSDFRILSDKDRYGLSINIVICKKCGLIQTNPRMTKESQLKFYEREYRKFYCDNEEPSDKFFEEQVSRGKCIYDLVCNYTKERFTEKVVVEIGTGAGGILQIFKENQNATLGLDLNTKYLKYGADKGMNLSFGTLDNLKDFKMKPDLVIYSHVLEHLPNPVEELRILKKYLKPSSIVYIEVPGVKDLKTTHNQNFQEYIHIAHNYHFSLKTLKNVIRKAGFEMCYENEGIISLLKISNSREAYRFESDYLDAVLFLQELEKLRKTPLNIYALRKKISSNCLFLAEKLGLSEIILKYYLKLKRGNSKKLG